MIRFAPFLVLLSFLAACTSEVAERPNCVLIVVDTLRADRVGCYGYGKPTTPNIDAIAAEGILFENAIAQAAYTLPSMATLFTALNPMSHGVRRHPGTDGDFDFLRPELETLPEFLAAQGYATQAVVSNSLFQKRFKAGFEAGFDVYDVGRRRRDAGPTTDIALGLIERNAEGETPFFMWVHYIDPHWPYDPPAAFERPFAHDDGGQFQHLLDRFNDKSLARETINFAPPLDADGRAAGLCAYDNEVAYADAQIGRLMAALKEKGLDGNTVVAVLSDHGEALGEHGLTFAHSFTLYDEVQRVVQIIRPAGGTAAARVSQQVRLLDFAPTLLSLLGFDRARGGSGLLADAEGRDVSPLWTEGRGALDELPAYAESEAWPAEALGVADRARSELPRPRRGEKWKMVRFKGFKLIWIPGAEWELYDLSVDPGEQTDLRGDPPAAAKPLAPIMASFLADHRSGNRSRSGGRLDEESRAELEEVLRAMGYGK